MSADPSPGVSGGADVGGRSLLRFLMAGLAGVGLLVAAYYSIAMPGMDHGGDTPTADTAAMDHGSAGDMSLDSDAFAARLGVDDAVVINVHTPYQGEIEGTGLFVPHDEIADDPRLPDRKDAEILLYCQTGRMSQTAAETLTGNGYTNVAHLEGGMRAWRADGRPTTSR
jgi:rhodanese-related sulfurtransferase